MKKVIPVMKAACRKVVVALPAHGTQKKKAQAAIRAAIAVEG